MAITPEGRDFAHHTTRKIVACIIGFLVIVPLLIFIFSEIVLHLWNWLMPALFHLSPLATFWQALGLMILSWILFGGLRGLRGPGFRHRGRAWRRVRDGWDEMSPEERDKFREWLRTRGATSGPTPYPGT